MSRIVFALVAGTLLTGCLKDGILPPRAPAEGHVRLTVDLVAGFEPLVLGTSIMDGAGNTIHITAFSCYLTAFALHDDDGHVVADFPASMVLLDGADPKVGTALGSLPSGHIHDIWFTAGAHSDVVGVGVGPVARSMRDAVGDPVHLSIQGFVDRNANGAFDIGNDVSFEVRPSGPDMVRRRHFHLHADMIDGKPLTLAAKVDLRLLLLGVDLLETPSIHGAQPMAVRIMDNFALSVSAR